MNAMKILDESLERVWKRTDRLFIFLLLFQWAIAVLVAVIASPYAWEGSQFSVHTHVWAAILLGGVIASFPVMLAVRAPGSILSRHSIAVAQMLFSALLIHLCGGRIETHFHIFGSLALLAFYRDWRVLVTATVVTGLDHVFRGILWPQSIYGVILASEWRTLEHVVWVLFIDAFLIKSCLWSRQEMQEIATKQSEMEDLLTSLQSTTVSKGESDQIIKQMKLSLEDAALQLRDTGKAISQVVEGEERMAAERAAAVTQTSASTEELHRTAQQTSAQATQSAEQSQRLFEVVSSGSQTANIAIGGMGKITEKFSVIDGEINSLCSKVNRINDIAIVVHDIADRTNLLALNAAVEAARAGEQGKGFSVVASAIRQLADHSKASIGELKDVINDIERASSSTVAATKHGSQSLEEGVAAVTEVSQVLQNVVDDIKLIAGNSSKIQFSSGEQTVALDQIRDSMRNISQGANATTAGVQKTREAVGRLNALTEELYELLTSETSSS